MLTKIKFALLSSAIALSVTACGGDDASKGIIDEATTAMNACKSKKGQMARANCVSPVLISANQKIGELVLSGDMDAEGAKKVYAELNKLGTEITGQ